MSIALTLLVFQDKTTPRAAADLPTLSPLFGSWLSAAGDVDGDRVPDFVVGDAGWEPSGSPAAYWVLSGKAGAEIASFHAEDGAQSFPKCVARADDRDGDGAADLWLEWPDARVVLWSGESRSVTRASTDVERSACFGVRLDCDFDGDGRQDVLRVVGEQSFMHSGRDVSVLW